MTSSTSDDPDAGLRRIPLSFSNTSSEDSALRLVYTVNPKWREEEGEAEIMRFTDGITNTVRRPSDLILRPVIDSLLVAESDQEDAWCIY